MKKKRKRLNQKLKPKKSEVGFIEKNRKKDYNIVYRNKQAKPMSVAELFGIPSKRRTKTRNKTRRKKKKLLKRRKKKLRLK